MITLFAATSGAMSLDQGEPTTTMTLHLQDPVTSDTPTKLSLTRLAEEREKAASRAGRSGRNPGAGGLDRSSVAERTRQQDAAEARERAEWERQQAAERAELTRITSAGDSNLVMDRTIRWVLPLSSFRLSARFGDSGSLWSNDHTGLDFSASTGTRVRSIAAGEITSAGWDNSYGYYVVVRHWDGTETWYCHLSGFARRSGTVGPGDVIGYVGSTGNSTGPHLHLEVRPGGGDPIDPLPWLRSFGLNI